MTVCAIFVFSSLHAIDNKANAQTIYKLKQQVSVVKHIAVIAGYFDVGKGGGVKAVQAAVVRSELRDLAKQLDGMNAYIMSRRNDLPEAIAQPYFVASPSVVELYSEYITSAIKITQLSEDDQKMAYHLRVITALKPQIESEINRLVALYYQLLVDKVAKQSEVYWYYIIGVFAAFAVTLFVFVLRPMKNATAVAREQAALANRIKNEFLASVSHEIRTPMHGIISAGENLNSTQLSDKQKNYVRTIISSADALLDVVNDILGYSALESGETYVEVERFNLFELSHDLVQLMDERAQLKNLELIMRYEDGVPHEVGADPSLIRQVLYHLLSNSIKFTESGYIVVTIDKDEPLERGDIALKFSVEDTGIGIESSKLSLIFEQFVQANGGTKRLFSGTGLGLSICKKLVELMGGNIRVGSVLGEGATFTFTLPVMLADNIARVEPQPPAVFAGTVLFICDDPDFKRAVLSDLGTDGLQVNGLQISCTTSKDFMANGAGGLDSIALFVVDYFVKEASPAKIIQKIRAARNFNGIKAVCFCRTHDLSIVQVLREQGFHGVFTFPADIEAFKDFLHAQSALQRAPFITAGMPKSPVLGDSVNYLRGANILLVEDNRINAALAEDILLDLGAKVTLAENGEVAVERVRAGHQFDLILMDCMMPVMDGFEATRLIRALPRSLGKALPIIALTANAMAGDKERCLEAGMNAYLSKPVRKKDLQQVMNKWLQGQHRAAGRTPSAAEHPFDTPMTLPANLEPDDSEAAQQSKPAGTTQDKTAVAGSPSADDTPNNIAIGAITADSSPPVQPMRKAKPPVSLKPKNIPAAADENTQKSAAPNNKRNPSEPELSNSSKTEAPAKTLNYLNAAAVAKAKNIMKHRFPTMIEYYLEDTQSYIDQIRRGLDEGSYAQL
ncbi:MAG TPA: ATP-binding protein, partial [Marinagarivorans sp.]